MCGMYATIGILAALRHRDQTGEGQHIDLALVDSQIAWLINEGVNYLATGAVPERRGNGHPNIAPYQVFETADGHVIIAVGNDTQFERFADWLGRPELAADQRFSTNPARLENRVELTQTVQEILRKRSTDTVIAGLEALKVPAGPVNTLDPGVFLRPGGGARHAGRHGNKRCRGRSCVAARQSSQTVEDARHLPPTAARHGRRYGRRSL